MQTKDQKVKILGKEWIIHFVRAIENDQSISGMTDPTSREMFIKTTNSENVKDFQRETANTIRHEVIHAFLFESGLGADWEHKALGHEETVVDWFAVMYPRIRKVFKQLGVEKKGA